MDNTQTTPTQTEDLLDGFQTYLVQAGHGKRFLNYLIDNVILYLVWRFLLTQLTVRIIVFLDIDLTNRNALMLAMYVIVLTFDCVCFALFETITGGKTPAKYITGTRAVNQDGTRISGKTATLRALSRLVPFEAFSALGTPSYPWHDSWTKTYVVDEHESQLLA